MTTEEYVCWICGGEADSKEHKAKASDITSILGKPTQHRPFHLRSNQLGNQILNSIKSNSITWNKKICSRCNNSLTSPFDKSWQKLSTHLQKIPTGISEINLEHIYKKKYKREFLNLYLYFIKLFGCYLVNSGVDVNIKQFSKSLLNTCDHPDFYIRISYFRKWPVKKMIALTDLYIANDKLGTCIAIAGYGIGPWCIDMTYCASRADKPPIIKTSVKPTKFRKKLKVTFN